MRIVLLAMCVAATACGVGPTDSIDDSASSAADLKSAPKVDSVTPSEATIGVLTTFTVTGKNLSGLQFQLTDCDGVKLVKGSTSKSRSFTCTPNHGPGQKGGALSNGFSFNVVSRTTCTTPIVVEGSFAPSGNDTAHLDSLFRAQNPIVSIVANGSTLTLTSRDGQTGTLSLSGATVDGTALAGADQGLDAFRIVDGSHLGLSSQGPYQQLTVGHATPTAPSEGFMFVDPIFNGTSWATSISGSGNTLVISDVFGATGVITLNCK